MRINKFILMVLIILSLFSCTKTYEPLNIEIISEESNLVNVEENDGYAIYHCNVTLVNNTSDVRHFKLEGMFTNEFEKDILEREKCFATTDEGNEIIRIDPNGSIDNLNIVFKIKLKDNYNGVTLKEDRLLPHINIIEQ